MAFLAKIFKRKTATEQTASKSAKPKAQTQPAAAPRPAPESLATTELLPFILSEKQVATALQALARLSQEADYVAIASGHSIAAIRLAAAEHVSSREGLQQLHNQVKNKDKSVLRLCKDRLNAVRSAEQAEHSTQERIHYLLTQARYLTKLGYQPEFNGKLQLLKQEWPTLAAQASADLQQAMEQELNQAEAILAQYANEENRLKQQRQEQAQAQHSQQSLLAQSQTLLSEALDSPLLHERIKTLETEWNSAFRVQPPSAELARHFEHNLQQLLQLHNANAHLDQIHAALEAWLHEPMQPNRLGAQIKRGENWLHAMHWPTAVPKSERYQALLDRLHELRKQEVTQQQKHHSGLQKAQQQLDELEQQLLQGHAKDASKLSQQLHQHLRQLPADKTGALRHRLQALTAQLNDLRDWAGFATEPKKQALVHAMQALINAPIAPDLLADKIHSLQEEWKTLSGSGADQELWQQFRAAADQAFEPCKAYFAEKAELRDRFLALRNELISELDQYEKALDWAQADFKIVQKTLDTARDTFKNYGPIDRAAHQVSQEAFDAVCARIFDHIKAEYDRNLQRKTALVDQAQALLATDSLQGIVEKVKALQNQWKEVGITPRAADQKLWQAFRTHCDGIFARLDSEREARKTELNTHISQAQALVEQASKAAKAQADNAAELLHEAKAQLHSLSLPKQVFQELNSKLHNLMQAKQQQAQVQQQQGLIQRLAHLHADESEWQQACQLPLPQHYQQELFANARKQRSSGTESGLDLCILLEIVTEQPTPAPDQARRMSLQVQRLAEGLGKGFNQEDEVRGLVERWLQVSADAALNQRFIQTLTARQSA